MRVGRVKEREMRTRFWWGNMIEIGQLEDTGLVGMKKMDLKGNGMGECGLEPSDPALGQTSGFCECDYGISGCLKCWNCLNLQMNC